VVRKLRDVLQKAEGQVDVLTLRGAGDDFTFGRNRAEPSRLAF